MRTEKAMAKGGFAHQVDPTTHAEDPTFSHVFTYLHISGSIAVDIAD